MSSDLLPMVGAIALPHLGGIVGSRLYPASTPWYDVSICTLSQFFDNHLKS